jgi:hypothetical protein
MVVGFTTTFVSMQSVPIKGVNKFGTNIKSMISLIKEQLMVLYVVRVKKKKGKKKGYTNKD